jgi:hypothetical protein
VIRSSVTGSVVETVVEQGSWSIDKFDGNGPSGFILDFSKIQILVIDFPSRMGRVRIGFILDGIIYYAHSVDSINSLTTPLLATSNLPLRYAVVATGVTAGAIMKQYGSSYYIEGGIDRVYQHRAKSVTGVAIDNNIADKPLISFRLKSGFSRSSIDLVELVVNTLTSDRYVAWKLYLRNTLTGATFADTTSSEIVDIDTAATAISGGVLVASGMSDSKSPIREMIQEIMGNSLLTLGSNYAGTSDILTITITALGSGSTSNFSFVWRELR